MKSGKTIKSMKLMAALFLVSFSAQAKPVIFQEPLSPRIANYDIEVKLDPAERLIRGREVLTWHNKTDQATDEMYFHLYLNAFRNDQSTFMKESNRSGSKKLDKKDGWGYIELERVSIQGGPDLTDEVRFAWPDDGNTADKTVAMISLPQAVEPGGSVIVEIDFASRLPSPPIARNGSKKEYHFASQWFPKVGVFEDGKWNCHQYHAHSEFYADFGVYDVFITVPEENIVGATGIEVEVSNNGDGTATHYYHAEDVHDFTWTTSPNFVVFMERVQDVDVRLLMQKNHKGQAKRHLEAARIGIGRFQEWFGNYPYPNLTIVDPRDGAFATGGMEYPTLITAGTFPGLPGGVRIVEMVVIHEFGHNFWYGMVASNEFEEAWLDEGINTYSEIQIMHDAYPSQSSIVDFLGFKFDDLQMRRYSYVRSPDYDPVVRKSWEYFSGGSYSAMAYSKPALALVTLENYLGRETMREIMRAYFERYKFKHPKTQDFIDVANEVSGQDLSWFFDQMLYTNAVLDYAVWSVKSEKVKPGIGIDYTDSIGGDKISFSGETETMFETVVKVRRLGDFKFPVEIELVFQNGETNHETWDGKDLWKEYRYLKPTRLASAAVDPEKKVVLDIDWKNNLMKAGRKAKSRSAGHGYLDMMKFMMNPD